MGNTLTAQDHKTVDLTELVKTQLFRQVSMAQVAALLRYCPTLTLTNGDKLIVPGQTVDQVHLLLHGRLQVFDGETTGRPVGHILQGECVGLSSYIDRQPCHVAIVSEGICRLLVLDEERLLALINTPTAVSRNLLFMLMTYLRDKAARAPQPASPPAPAPEPHHHIDAVTGLHNQRWLDETLERLILRAATEGTPLSLVAVELSDLPGLTAQYGQEMLDLSLRAIARTLGDTVRPTDLIAAHATGRFVIMLPGTNQENAETAVSRIQDTVNSTDLVIPGVCVLPPMRIVAGGVQMKAFVSGRKLTDDAFAALERNRAIMLATLITPAPEATAEPPSPAADIAAGDLTATAEPADLTLVAAEPSPAAPAGTADGAVADLVTGDAFSDGSAPESVAGFRPEDPLGASDVVPPEPRPDDPSHLAA